MEWFLNEALSLLEDRFPTKTLKAQRKNNNELNTLCT